MEIVGYSKKAPKILADLHTHTMFSLHAFGTVDENAKSAKQNGMEFVGITDHYYQLGEPLLRKNEVCRMCDLRYVKPENGATIIGGGEFNIAHKLADDIDTERLYRDLHWRLIGLHNWFINPKETDITMVPTLFGQSISLSQYVTPTAFAHIERSLREFKGSEDDDKVYSALKEIVQIAISNDIFLELNEQSFKYGGENIAFLKYWAGYAKINGAKFCLGTDSHSRDNVGVFTNVEQFIADNGLDKSYILNYDRAALANL